MKLFWFFGIFLCAGVVIALHFFGILRPIENTISISLGRVGATLYSIRLGMGGYANGLRGVDYSERVRLEKEVLRLEKEKANFKMTQGENETLKKMLHFSEIIPTSSVIAQVIGESADDASNSLVLDKGRLDGIRENRVVVTDDGVVVGKTFAVADHTSHVLLLTDNHSKIIGSILAKRSATGIIRGEFQIGLMMDLIPITEKIQKNDLVVTAGREEGIPAGLLIGTVSDIKTRPTDFYQTTSIRPFLDTSSVRIVSILN